MLVRFLSFAASVIGTRRYRPLLLSLVAIVFSVGSATALLTVLRGQPHSAASATGQDTQAQRQAASLEGLDTQTPHAEPSKQSANTNQTPSVDQNDTPKMAGTSGQSNNLPSTEINVSASAITLSSASPALTVNASMSDKSTANWTVAAADGQSNDIIVNVEQGNGTQNNVNVRFRLEHNAEPGTYQFTIAAKDQARGLDLSKKIIVTVNP